VNVLAVSDFLRPALADVDVDVDVDEKYLADLELRRAAASRPVGGAGLGLS